MEPLIRTLLAVLLVSACSSIMDGEDKKHSEPKKNENSDQVQESSQKSSDEARVDPEQPNIPEQPDDKKPTIPENQKPADDCESLAACTAEYAPASCIYKGVTKTSSNRCEASLELFYLFQCEKKETFDWKLITCTPLENPDLGKKK